MIARANRSDKKQQSAQDSIPYQRMYPDGVCRVTDTRYVKTIRFQDINYQLSQNEDKTAIFDGWCEFLKSRFLLLLLAVMLCMAAFSLPTFAYTAETPMQEETPALDKTPETPEESGDDDLTDSFNGFGDFLTAFTPDGNLSLIDDFLFSGMNDDGEKEERPRRFTEQMDPFPTCILCVIRFAPKVLISFWLPEWISIRRYRSSLLMSVM